MKKSLLLTVAALMPLTLSAQDLTAAAGGGLATAQDSATLAPVTTPSAPRLPEVEFNGTALSEVVLNLREMAKNAGVDPNGDPLNIVISPGLEDLAVPALSLRNVSPTEVLSVATTVLGLRMEPVMGDDGNRIVAWLIKRQEAAADPFGGPSPAAPVPVHVSEGGTTAPVTLGGSGGSDGGGATGLPGPGRASSSGFTGSGGSFTVPAPVAIAGSSGGGGVLLSSPAPAARVFGITSLIAPSEEETHPEPGATREDAALMKAVLRDQRSKKLQELIESLDRLAKDQSGQSDIKAYDNMDIIVVKCSDAGTLTLIAEAIEAMKTNREPGKAPRASRSVGTGLRDR